MTLYSLRENLSSILSDIYIYDLLIEEGGEQIATFQGKRQKVARNLDAKIFSHARGLIKESSFFHTKDFFGFSLTISLNIFNRISIYINKNISGFGEFENLLAAQLGANGIIENLAKLFHAGNNIVVGGSCCFGSTLLSYALALKIAEHNIVYANDSAIKHNLWPLPKADTILGAVEIARKMGGWAFYLTDIALDQIRLTDFNATRFIVATQANISESIMNKYQNTKVTLVDFDEDGAPRLLDNIKPVKAPVIAEPNADIGWELEVLES